MQLNIAPLIPHPGDYIAVLMPGAKRAVLKKYEDVAQDTQVKHLGVAIERRRFYR